MIKTGEKAPDFELKDTFGNLVKLSTFKGKEVVLYFYPKDNTPGCTAEACSFRDNYSLYKKENIVIIGVSKDDEKSHKKFVEKYELPFTLLADTEKKVCKLYEVWGKKKFMGREFEGIIRTTFLIDKQGKIKEILKDIDCKKHADDVIKILRD